MRGVWCCRWSMPRGESAVQKTMEASLTRNGTRAPRCCRPGWTKDGRRARESPRQSPSVSSSRTPAQYLRMGGDVSGVPVRGPGTNGRNVSHGGASKWRPHPPRRHKRAGRECRAQSPGPFPLDARWRTHLRAPTDQWGPLRGRQLGSWTRTLSRNSPCSRGRA